MKRADIVAHVASEGAMTKQAAETAVGAVFASISEALARGEDVTVTGFGRFARIDRPAREGRNPRTGRAHRHRAVVRGVVQGRQGAEGRAELTTAGRQPAGRAGEADCGGHLRSYSEDFDAIGL